MTIDGLAMANLGIYRPTSPSEASHQAEQSAKAEAEIIFKQLGEVDKAIAVKDEEKNKQQDQQEQKKDEEQQDNLKFEEGSFEISDNFKKYKVRFNEETQKIELVDILTDSVVETIQPEDLVNLMTKSKNPSGVLVDRAI